MNRNLITLVVLIGATALPASADEVVLRRSVRIRHDGEVVMLADIARIDGEYAMKFAQLKIARFDDRSRPLEISVTEVEDVLDRAGVNRALLDLSGSRVIVRPFHRSNPQSDGPGACEPLKIENVADNRATFPGADTESPNTSDERTIVLDPRAVVGEDTARGLIAARLAPHWRNLTVPVRLLLKTSEPDILARREARPTVMLDGRGGRISHPFSVTLEGERTVRVIASIEVNVIANRAVEDLKRGTRIVLREVEALTQWVGLHDMDAVRTTSEMIGMRLDSRVAAGELLKRHHFEPIVRRNDTIKVHSSGRGFTIEMDCISLEDGRIGETIKVRTDTPGRPKRNAKPISVVVVDAGRAEFLN